MKRNGFTLIELLMVISIIIMITSMTVIMLPTMLKGQGLKQSGYLIKNAFSQARQLAASERLMHFIYFMPDKGTMLLYEDTDDDKKFNRDTDTQVAPPIKLSKDVIFLSENECPPLFKIKDPYVAFRNDGSIIFPNGVEDLPLDPNPNDTNTDIILVDSKKRPGKVFLDIEASGIIRKIIYKPE
ncbi:MAG: prepilin-type N-terminal cleavage/methylation domain-containing protein [Planctomycetes bacterium]|nr:prepilin-type N-terminal cleavage/methylation domain-containing protein [Planctomycetota bacterium]